MSKTQGLMAVSINPRKFYDVAALLTWVLIVGAAITRHEPWAAEAQAWLLARDLGWFRLVFSELRYEGHPALWHTILWIAIHWFHAPYAALGWIGFACAASGAAVLIFLAPLPRPLRYLIAFSFYFLYQYAVVARSYNLLPLLAFLAAWFYRKGPTAVIPFTLTLVLLANVSIHGLVIAAALAIGYGWRRFGATSWILFSLTLLFLLGILWPPAGTVALDEAAADTMAQHLALFVGGIAIAFTNSISLSWVVALLLYIWCRQRGVRSIYAISLLGSAIIFGFLRGGPHHAGIPVVAAVTALWCGWPPESEVRSFSPSGLRWYRGSAAAIGILFAYQSWWSLSAIRTDWQLPYSGALEAAQYIKSVGADRAGIDCFGDLSIGILPYFDSNICNNLRTAEGFSFFHNSVGFRGRAAVTPANLKSRWVVAVVGYSERQPATEAALEHAGYEQVHVSTGTPWFHSAIFSQPQVYLIYRRKPGY